jgi:hypothetical protein
VIGADEPVAEADFLPGDEDGSNLTGLYYNGFRYYDSEDGRYLTPDPVDPSALNAVRRFVRENPGMPFYLPDASSLGLFRRCHGQRRNGHGPNAVDRAGFRFEPPASASHRAGKIETGRHTRDIDLCIMDATSSDLSFRAKRGILIVLSGEPDQNQDSSLRSE